MFRDESYHQRYADRRHRGRRNWDETGFHPGDHAARIGKEPFMHLSICTTGIWRGCSGDHTRSCEINELYSKSPTIESENFRNLLLSFAEDMRVILIIIADRVNLMRQIKETPNIEARTKVANEAAYLYAPLAHKLGLYKLKSELEDLSLKYTEHDVYYHIKDKLNETKASRDKYIAAFIEPIQHKLEEAGLKFHMKGRTKSIHSIYQKMKKQKCPFEGVYDLFAIRIILDSPVDKENKNAGRYIPL